MPFAILSIPDFYFKPYKGVYLNRRTKSKALEQLLYFKPYKGVYLNKTEKPAIIVIFENFKPYKGVYLNNYTQADSSLETYFKPYKGVYLNLLLFERYSDISISNPIREYI